jgi:hypothetical protein
MGVNKSRHHRLALEVNNLGGLSLQALDCRPIAHAQNLAILDGNRFRFWLSIIDRNHVGVEINFVGDRLVSFFQRHI